MPSSCKATRLSLADGRRGLHRDDYRARTSLPDVGSGGVGGVRDGRASWSAAVVVRGGVTSVTDDAALV